MKYPMFKVHINKTLALKNLDKVLSSGFINEGEQVTELTQRFSEYFDHDQIVPLNSCTSAITLALKLSDVGPGDEVISTSMTCVASNTPIHNVGGKIVWADINQHTGNIDVEEVKKLITPKTKAVLCVNWAGLPCELEKLQTLCEENNIKLIQDAAHSFGSLYKEKQVCHFSDFTCYSLQAIKHITSGDGGILVCNNKEDYEKAKKLKWFGIDREATKDEKGEWKGQRWDVDVKEAGYKFHMNNISAAIGLSQIDFIDSIIMSHKNNAKIYAEEFKDNSFISPLTFPKNSTPSHWVYTVLLDPKIDRDYIIQYLNSEGIQAGLVHTPNHYYTCYKESNKSLPSTEYFSKHQISLPCGWWLSSYDVKLISQTFKNIVKEKYTESYYVHLL